MRILLVASAFNSLTQRVQVELRERGHTVTTEVVREDHEVRDAVGRHRPELVVAPMLKTAVPEDVWTRHTCLIVHPGPPGDRGPSSLDWAIHEGRDTWGVTVLQADGEMDAGDIWASASFPVECVGKSDLYRGEASDAAMEALALAIERFESGTYRPSPQQGHTVRVRPVLRQDVRRIDWASGTDGILRALRAADSQPGILDDRLPGGPWYLHGGHPEDRLRGAPGEVVATRAEAVCVATGDGAVWIPQLRRPRRGGEPASVKLPATVALGTSCPDVPELPADPETPATHRTFADVRYEEHDGVGYVRFSFPGGAMSTAQCRRVLSAYRHACRRPTRVVVLGGSRDFFSNGIHLGVIEAASDPARESWANIHAMNDLVEAVLTTTDRLVVAALGGNAAAGGAMLAIAADEVWCRSGTVLNPHYRLMGLPGSEYWTYSLPRRLGPDRAEALMHAAEPVGVSAAQRMGLVDRIVTAPPSDFGRRVAAMAADLAADPETHQRITDKKRVRARDEAAKPLAAYRDEELARMRRTFFDPAAPYHALRAAFVRKQPSRPATPSTRAPSPTT
ncbi:MAG: hydrogenase maturation protein [Streptomycetaceae bacterium]|nr:hydrogenase maturation protein [Streptomycetaceae bacterium]